MNPNSKYQLHCESCGATPAYWRYFCNKVLCRACTIKAIKIYIAGISAVVILGFVLVSWFTTPKHVDIKPRQNTEGVKTRSLQAQRSETVEKDSVNFKIR
jgi:hypothetical protein